MGCRLALVSVVVSATAAAVWAQPGEELRDGEPMQAVRTRSEVCRAPCRVVAKTRVGSAVVQVLRSEWGRRDGSWLLYVQQGRRRHAVLLGADGAPGFGSYDRVGYFFGRLERVDVDSDGIDEIAVLSGAGTSAEVRLCQIAPRPCCLAAMTPRLDPGGRPAVPRVDPRGRLVDGPTPIRPRFCGPP